MKTKEQKNEYMRLYYAEKYRTSAKYRKKNLEASKRYREKRKATGWKREFSEEQKIINREKSKLWRLANPKKVKAYNKKHNNLKKEV